MIPDPNSGNITKELRFLDYVHTYKLASFSAGAYISWLLLCTRTLFVHSPGITPYYSFHLPGQSVRFSVI